MRPLFLCLVLTASLAACSTDTRKPESAASSSSATPDISTASSASDSAGRVSTTSAEDRLPAGRSVYYDFENSKVHDSDLSLLKENARYLTAHLAATVTIEGNCDERGSDAYNVGLGERRALAAKQLLESYGVGANRINVVSYGKEKPKATCHGESCWKENRRSDLVYARTG